MCCSGFNYFYLTGHDNYMVFIQKSNKFKIIAIITDFMRILWKENSLFARRKIIYWNYNYFQDFFNEVYYLSEILNI